MARRRPARSVKTVGARPFRLDDAVGVSAPPSAPPTTLRIEDLSGRTGLDERIARALQERAKFEGRTARRSAAETKG